MNTRGFLVAGVASLAALRTVAAVEALGDSDVAAAGNVANEPEPEPDTRSRQVRRAEERAATKKFGLRKVRHTPARLPSKMRGTR